MIVTFIYADSIREFNCSLHNCVKRSRAINKLPEHQSYLIFVDDFNKNLPWVQEVCNKSDAIIIERNLFEECLVQLMYWKVKNKSIITLFDDDYSRIKPSNISHKFWTNGEIKGTNEKGEELIHYMRPKPLEQLKWGLQMSKGCIMPSRVLADDWKFATDTYYFPNQIEMSKYINTQPLIKEDYITIGWCGSLSHLPSFTDSGLLKAIQRLDHNKDYSHVKFLISGDKRIFDAINFNKKKKIFSNFVPEKDWSNLLTSIDLGLAPLYDSYDMRRSFIKVLEYMALQIPFIASDVVTYEELRPYGTLVQNTEDAWYEALKDNIDNLQKYKERAKGEAFEFAKQQDMDVKVHEFLALLQTIIDKPYK